MGRKFRTIFHSTIANLSCRLSPLALTYCVVQGARVERYRLLDLIQFIAHRYRI